MHLAGSRARIKNEAPAPPRRSEQGCSPAHRGPGLPAGRRARAAAPGAEAEIPQQEGAEARQGEDRGQTSAGQRQPRRLAEGRRPQERAALGYASSLRVVTASATALYHRSRMVTMVTTLTQTYFVARQNESTFQTTPLSPRRARKAVAAVHSAVPRVRRRGMRWPRIARPRSSSTSRCGSRT